MNAITKLAPWRSKPLAVAAKQEKFRETMSLSAERVILGRSAIIAGWAIGSAGLFLMTASVVGWVQILPLKTTVDRLWIGDKATGIISEAPTFADGLRVLGPSAELHYLQLYAQARLNWIPENDQANDHLVKIMSRPDEQARYMEERASPAGPIHSVGKDGHATTDNLRFHREADGSDGVTHRYTVQFIRSIWQGKEKQSAEPWTATVDFQWHPELPMKESDRYLNPPGLQVVSFSASSDIPNQARH